jgi:hypothetical protein
MLTGMPTEGLQDSSQGAGDRREQRAGDRPRPGAGGRPGQGASDRPGQGAPDRYEPLPGIAGLPAWIWRKLPRPARIALALLPVAGVGLVLLLAPGIDESKEDRARSEAERRERATAERLDQLRAEQRPRFRRGQPAGENLARRAALVGAVPAAIEADARRRVAAGELDGPIRSVECEPFPRTVDGRGAHLDADEARGRYSCLAVTSVVSANERNEAGVIGHPYRAMVNFDTGRYAFCKVSGRPGEFSIARQPFAPTPAVCGG